MWRKFEYDVLHLIFLSSGYWRNVESLSNLSNWISNIYLNQHLRRLQFCPTTFGPTTQYTLTAIEFITAVWAIVMSIAALSRLNTRTIVTSPLVISAFPPLFSLVGVNKDSLMAQKWCMCDDEMDKWYMKIRKRSEINDNKRGMIRILIVPKIITKNAVLTAIILVRSIAAVYPQITSSGIGNALTGVTPELAPGASTCGKCILLDQHLELFLGFLQFRSSDWSRQSGFLLHTK